MKRLVVLLVLAAPANAQTSWTSRSEYSNCFADGLYWMERGFICHANPPDRKSVSVVGNGALSSDGTSITSTSMPKCPDGYSPILRSSGNPACARDIIDVE